MKTTLTMEVPKNFKKGDCHWCTLRIQVNEETICPIVGTHTENCPLKIIKPRSKKRCKNEGND